MPPPITVAQIVAERLKAGGFDGLFHDDCACDLADLFPCGAEGADCCCAGVRMPCDCDCGDGHDYHIGPGEGEDHPDPDPEMVYVGRKKPCGCIVAFTDTARPGGLTDQQVGEHIGEFAADGLTVHLITAEQLRATPQGCTHGQLSLAL